MTDANNTIIFSKGRSIITSDKDGKVANAAFAAANPINTTELEKKGGAYTFDMWINKQSTNYTPPGTTITTTTNSVTTNKTGTSHHDVRNYKNIGEISRDFAWLDDEVM